jgi:uncharacterized membrane protein YfcA
MSLDLAFYALAVPGVLLTGISKGGLSGLGALTVPMLALVLPPGQAVGLMLPILCLMDLFGLWAYRKTWSRQQLGVLLAGAMVGIFFGILAFDHLNDDAVRIAIGANALVFTALQWVQPLLNRGKSAEPAPQSNPKGFFWSGISGFASYIAHAGGPPLLMYLLPQRMEKMLLAGTTVVYFAIVNFVKLVPYLWFGQIDATNFSQALILAPLAPLGIWIGYWLTKRMDSKTFYKLSHLLLLVAGLKLTYDGLRGLGVF